MKKKSVLKTCAVLAGLLACQGAFAADDLTVTAGVKMWNNKWTSWDAIPSLRTGAGIIPGYSENYTSSDNAAWIPSLSMRYRDFMAAGSYFVNHSYGMPGASGNFNADRKEMDAVVGYYVLPTVALIGGYKEVKQSFKGAAGNSDFTYSGPIFGVNASAPLTGGFSLYGTAALGRLDAKLPGSIVGTLTSNNYNADYKLAEVGIAYAFDVRASMPGVKSLVATFGYRSQVIATKADLRDTPTTTRSTELRDTTEGLTLGLTAVF